MLMKHPSPGRFLAVRDVLELPVLVEGLPRVLAGASRLSRAVRWVHVTELLNPADFLEGGESALTTGVPYPEDASCVPGFAGHQDRWRSITMVPLLLVLLLALILFGAGFALKALWWIAVVVLVVWLLGFVMRSADTGGRRGRWYRW